MSNKYVRTIIEINQKMFGINSSENPYHKIDFFKKNQNKSDLIHLLALLAKEMDISLY